MFSLRSRFKAYRRMAVGARLVNRRVRSGYGTHHHKFPRAHRLHQRYGRYGRNIRTRLTNGGYIYRTR